jgi:uncharacterized protein YuzE
MKITYDDAADVVGFEISPTPANHTREQGNGVLVGYDEGNRVVSIQVLDASKHFDNETLALLRSPATPLSLAEAAKESGLAAATLRVLLNSGRLKGSKRGRDWIVTVAELDTYLASRAPAGRPAFRYKARRIRPMILTDPAEQKKASFFGGPGGVARKQRAAKLDPKGIAVAARKMFGAKKGPKTRKK